MTPNPIKVEAPELRLDPERIIEDGIDWDEVFGPGGPVEVEVGIGKGRFLLAAAAVRPESRFLGLEWANKYLRFAEYRALRRGLKNVRFARVDARELVSRAIPAESVAAYYVFYPDPWPKKRHQKRRFFRPETIDHVVRTLVPGGLLHVATDHAEYWESIHSLLDGHDAFDRLDRFGGSGFPLDADAPLTNFEAKYDKEGRRRFRGSWKRVSDNGR
jgi:tRNA (guanine-N7-)-methyltransferase